MFINKLVQKNVYESDRYSSLTGEIRDISDVRLVSCQRAWPPKLPDEMTLKKKKVNIH